MESGYEVVNKMCSLLLNQNDQSWIGILISKYEV